MAVGATQRVTLQTRTVIEGPEGTDETWANLSEHWAVVAPISADVRITAGEQGAFTHRVMLPNAMPELNMRDHRLIYLDRVLAFTSPPLIYPDTTVIVAREEALPEVPA